MRTGERIEALKLYGFKDGEKLTEDEREDADRPDHAARDVGDVRVLAGRQCLHDLDEVRTSVN